MMFVLVTLAPAYCFAEDKPDPLPAAARHVVERYNLAVSEARMARDAAVLNAAEAARKELSKVMEAETRAGRLEPALAVKAQIEKLPVKPEDAGASSATELIVQALIDGEMELHVTPAGLYWKWLGVLGSSVKTGDSGVMNEPVFVNGQSWKLTWDPPVVNVSAKTALLPLKVGPVENLKVELVAVGPRRTASGVESRDPIRSRVTSGEFVVAIPDSQPGSRWYTLLIVGIQPR
jgi:hypothetical protein